MKSVGKVIWIVIIGDVWMGKFSVICCIIVNWIYRLMRWIGGIEIFKYFEEKKLIEIFLVVVSEWGVV